jgi:hypothetical protein
VALKVVLAEGVLLFDQEVQAVARLADLEALPPAEQLERDRAEAGAIRQALALVGVELPPAKPTGTTRTRRTVE